MSEHQRSSQGSDRGDRSNRVLREAFGHLERRLTRSGQTLPPDVAAEHLSDVLYSVLPLRQVPHALDRQVGPFLTTKQVSTYLGRGGRAVSRQAVESRRHHHTLLGCRTADGIWLYPTFQFLSGDTVEGLLPVLVPFRELQLDGWTLAVWATTPLATLEGYTPSEWLRRRLALDPVVDAARRQARQWGARVA